MIAPVTWLCRARKPSSRAASSAAGRAASRARRRRIVRGETVVVDSGAKRVADWLERAAAAGADGVLIADTHADVTGARLRRAAPISPVPVGPALGLEHRLRPADARLVMGRQVRVGLRFVAGGLRDTAFAAIVGKRAAVVRRIPALRASESGPSVPSTARRLPAP